MSTIKQQRAAEILVENGGNVSKAMRDAGYTDQTAKTPSKLTKSKGFMELMDDGGLTDELIIQSLVDDIRSKPGNRTTELMLAAKLRGRLTKPQNDYKGEFPTPILGGLSNQYTTVVEFI